MTQTDLDEYYDNLLRVRQDIKHVERQIAIYVEPGLVDKRQKLHKRLQYWLKKINLLEGMYNQGNN